MTNPIKYYKGDRDYYPRSDPRFKDHINNIDTHNRIGARIDASADDHSYSVMIAKKDIDSR